LIHSTGSRVKKLPSNINKDSPEYIKAQVERSFEIAALKLQDPSRVRHPTKRNVKLVSSFPLLPDLNSFTDAGGYVNVKFQHNPVPPSNVYDTRIASSILRPLEPTADRQAARELAIANHEQDPERYPYPEYEMDFEFFLLEQGQNAANYKRKSDMLDARRDDESLYTHSNKDGSQAFRFKRVREYETATSVDYPSLRRYEEEIIVAINDGKDGVHQRAAFYYPLTQRTMIRPQRKKNMDQKRFGAQAEITEDGQHVDILDVKIRDADESELEFRGAWKENPLYEGPQDVIEETAETNGNGQQRHDSEDGEGESE
jgi:RNA polymerase II-associated factor 1